MTAGQALQTQRPSPATRTIELLSPGLRKLLSDGDNSTAVEALATSPSALDEALAVLVALEREAAKPAGAEAVKQVISRRFVLYPQPERTPQEWNHWWAAYFEVLANIPVGALEAGMVEWAKSAAEFLPKPGQLLALANDHPGKEQLAVLRIRAAQRWTPPAEPQAPSVEERARVKELLNEFRASMPEKTVTAGPRANQAKTDDSGVSPSLRALIEKQRNQA